MLRSSLLAALVWIAGVLSLSTVQATGRDIDLNIGLPKKKQHIEFQAWISPMDPFSEMNQIDPPTDPKRVVQRGDTFILTIKGTLEKGWRTYPFTKLAPGQPKGVLGTMKIENDNLQPIYPLTESEPELKPDTEGLGYTQLIHSKPFVLRQEVYLKPSTPEGQTIEMKVNLRVQVCDKSCVWEDHVLTVPLNTATGPALPVTDELKARLAVKPTEIVEEPVGGSSTGSKWVERKPVDEGWWSSILTAIVGGLVSLLTPCVFPMVPITVSFFLKQSEAPASGGSGIQAGASESAPRGPSPLLLALLYSATIVLVMTLGGMVLMQVLVQISTHSVTNFVLGAIFVFFALSLLGMYEITLPSWLQDATASREGRGGYLGVFFMALTFSIISFTCVGPIYGSFITLQASSSSPTAYLRQFTSVFAFSAAFAAPFFLLALFPGWLRTMPRAGSWMNSVKVVMGFLELAAAVKFLRAGELALTSSSNLFTFDLSLGIYIALALACGLYLLGLFKLPHDHDTAETIGVPRLMFSLMFITLGLYLIPGLFKTNEGDSQRPKGTVFAWVESFLLPDTDGKTKLNWHHNLDEALAQAQRENKLLFIDFTGTLCTNCKLNERNVFPRPEVEKALAQHVLLKLYTDTVPSGVEQKPNATEALNLRDTKFETSSLPLYALVRPTKDGYDIVRKDEQGLISDIPNFIAFLKP